MKIKWEKVAKISDDKVIRLGATQSGKNCKR